MTGLLLFSKKKPDRVKTFFKTQENLFHLSLSTRSVRPKKNSYVSAVPAGWNFFSAHPGAWEIHYSIFSFHTQIPLLFSALFTLTPAWLNSEVEISGKRNTQSPSISFWQHRIIGKTFFLCLWYDQINVSNTNDGVVSQKKSNPGRPGEIFFGHPQRRKHSFFFRPYSW